MTSRRFHIEEDDLYEPQMPIQQNTDQSFMNMVKHQPLVFVTIYTHMRAHTHISFFFYSLSLSLSLYIYIYIYIYI
ncbi:hypothetical protein Hanom_Chr09g00774021 [Helianthus anomalus]